ncbi:F0F1 ATP synthase subunit epsilon [Jonesia denitrificans]|uniref:ATP synthase epsilon chain n=1 Tax=Jonesia denitrificans (strain ATCC 14870 / DSM 20603 / BCRC 15368 / CIP 55.134 / JCM 11481 / NBRC 15587 / NCTC 10816 / Prevot 55134) TaxID=471856 RepID=C7QZB8_JONDD|nr:F0F1 ATP synthase subunit epsilon [Jonesia denitrificans]ACV09416.1 H+transporting two-sector ATPase delta/epsilon subunit [Jonesia denitrificans DSM 20603]ASE09341.1 F0F1 ATP synthase subunit epsilon [Jonesia denitrificans]QXB43882.1 F0F1 ATP synthase subunit epsilon [Jonesia denitrificans]SQH21742.1 F-ATPase epsilon subunit [Jonesia denitrificans]
MAVLTVDVVAADRKVWSGDASLVSAPAADGEIGILAGHSPILSALTAGTVRVSANNGVTHKFTVSGGFLSVDQDVVTVVVDEATVVSDHDAK